MGIFEVFFSHLLKHYVSASLIFPVHWTKLSLIPTHTHTHRVSLECCIVHLGYKCIQKKKMGRESFHQRSGWNKINLGRMSKSVNAIIITQWEKSRLLKALWWEKAWRERERENLEDRVLVNERLKRVRANIKNCGYGQNFGSHLKYPLGGVKFFHVNFGCWAMLLKCETTHKLNMYQVMIPWGSLSTSD